MICWGGSQGDHPCRNEGTRPSGLCEACGGFASRIAEGLKTVFVDERCPFRDCPAGGTGELCDDDHCRELR